MRRIIKFLTLSIVFCANLFAVDAQMEIVKQGVNLPKISINIAQDTKNIVLVDQISKILEKDLEVSGHFEVLRYQEPLIFEQRPNLVKLRNEGIDLILSIAIKDPSFDGIALLVRLYDVNTGEMVLNRSFASSRTSRYPFIAHRVAILLNDYMKAPKIDWMDDFVIFSRLIGPKESEIVISDYTLTYQKVIVKGGLNIFPKWANAEQKEFYYTTYNKVKPTLVKTNIYTGQITDIASSDGMIAVSDISSDGKKLILTMAPQNQPDIYIYNVDSRTMSRLTSYSGIDVGGHFVDGDRKVVFVSDRLNYPNVFLQGIGSRAVERIVFHGRNNASVTTYKNYIVYSSREGDNEFSKGAFNLYLASTQSDFVKRLTVTGKNQFPKFSSDGESLLFIKEHQGLSSLGVIRLNHDKAYTFPLNVGDIQSIDW